MKSNRLRLKKVWFVLILLTLVVLSACGGDEAVEPEEVAQQASSEESVVESGEEVAEVEVSPTDVPPTEVPPTEEPPATAVSEPTAISEPTAVPEEETAVTGDDLMAELMQSFSAQQDIGAWRATQTINDGEVSIESIVEFQSPDRYRVTMDIGEGIPFETVMIGDTMYQNIGGTWMELPMELGGELANMINDPQAMMENSIEDIAFLGTEEFDGESAKVYRFTAVDTITDSPSNSEVFVWIRESDNLPLKQEMTFSGDGVEGQMTQVYDYDVDINIEPPQ